MNTIIRIMIKDSGDESRARWLGKRPCEIRMPFGSVKHEIYDMLVIQSGFNISLLADWLSNKPPLSKHEFTSRRGYWCFQAHPPGV